MPDDPLLAILDKIDAPREARVSYAAQLNLLADLANYGSRLLARCFRQSERQLADIVVLGLFLKQVVGSIDAYQVLLAEACALAATAHGRSLLEASLYIDWLLQEHTADRATCFYVSHLRTRRMWCRRMIPGTHEHQKYLEARKALTGKEADSPLPVASAAAEAQAADIDRVLSSAEFAALNERFDQLRGRRPFDPPWHAACGVPSLRSLAIAVNRLAEYTYSYSPASEYVHSADLRGHLELTPGNLRLMNLRTLAGFETTFRFTVGITLHIFEAILRHYRPGELPAFQRRYRDEWHGPFIQLPEARINITSVSLDP